MATARGSSVRGAPIVFGVRIFADDELGLLYIGEGLPAPLGAPAGVSSSVTAALRVAPDDEHALRESLRVAARAGQPWRFAWRAHGPSGPSGPSGRDLWLEAAAYPIREGGVTTLHGYLRESSRRDGLDGLREDAARFRSIVEASPVPYAINDEHQNVTYVNPAFVATFGYSLADIPTLAKWWPQAYPDSGYRRWVEDEWRARLDRARSSGEPFEAFEVRIRAKDGSERFAIVGALSLESEFRGTHVVVLLDITARKRAEEARLALERQMQHAQKLESLGVLAGGIAHDFNNLLMGIVGNADVALAELPAESSARSRLEAIMTAARRASEVADQMLAYAGKGKFVVAPVAINDLVAETSELLEFAISKHVTLRYDFAPDLPRFDADATQVRQVVMNLITNASEAIGDRPGTVALTTGVMTCDRAYLEGPAIVDDGMRHARCREGTYVFVEVADDGCGIPPETVRRIFEPFFTTKFAGRGLGLSALLGIVHGHSGAIAIDSAVGKGTTIRVLFPSTTAASEPSTALARSRLPGHGCVLLVDDDDMIRNAVGRMLELLGFGVLLAANGRDAIDKFRDRHRDIAAVIVDLTMPVLDGEQVFHELRAIRGDVKVILASGYTNYEVSRRFAGSGPSGFLKKPFDSDDLERVLGEALASAADVD